MKMGMKNALCCFLMLVSVFGACFHLPFIAFYCLSLLFLVFEIESILKNPNNQMSFVARYGFLMLVLVFCGCFHLSIALLVVAFRWYKKPKRAIKPGFRLDLLCLSLLALLFSCPFWFFQHSGSLAKWLRHRVGMRESRVRSQSSELLTIATS